MHRFRSMFAVAVVISAVWCLARFVPAQGADRQPPPPPVAPQPAPPPGAPNPVPLPPQPPPPMPAQAPPPAPRPPTEPTRLQVEFYQLVATSEQLAELDMDKLQAGKPSVAELLKRLSAVGEARLLVRLDNQANLASRSNLTAGTRVPTVQDIGISKDGKTSPSITYQEVGVSLQCTGQWLAGERDGQARIDCNLGLSNVTKSPVQVASGVKLPMFNQFKLDQQLVVSSGQAILLMSSQVPPPGDEPVQVAVTLVRLTATRLGPPPVSPAHE